VPPEDLESIAELVSGFRRIVVECHPRLVDESCLQFADRLEGRLEVAMGLETAHPEVLAKLNKQMSLEDFEAATRILRSAQIDVRAFVLLAPPFLPLQESVDWAVRTTRYAWDLGVGLVSIVPLRSGNGEMERLAELGLFEPPNLVMLEETMVRAVESPSGVVLADLWEADRLEACPECREPRMERLRIINRTGQSGHEIACIACDQREGGRD
jgi:radical SAM enzyme (TIGR01210 family)